MIAAAHRRPGVIALWFLYRAAAALLIAAPIAATAGATVSGYPRGDAELLDPGATMLLEAARLSRRALPALLVSGGSVALLAAVIGLLPFAAVIAALGHEGRAGARFLAGRAIEHVGTLALLWGAGIAAGVIVALLVVMLGGKLTASLNLGTRAEDLADVAVFAIALLAATAVGMVRDLASVAAVHGGHRFYVATSRALHALGAAPRRILWAWAWRGALGLAAVAAAAALAPRAASALLLAAAVHQAGLAAAVFARASWLAAAIRLLDDTAPAAHGEPPISEPPASKPPAPEPSAPEPAAPDPSSHEPSRSEPAPSDPSSHEPSAPEPAASEPAAPEPPPATPRRSDS